MFITDRSEWPPGLWNVEPDQEKWTDETSGLRCIAYRGPLGAWNGYVEVPKGNRLHGVDFGDLEYGGDRELSWSGAIHGFRWALGFDCAHSWDIIPAMPEASAGYHFGETYRDLKYVKRQCAHLAAFVAAQSTAQEVTRAPR